MLMSRSTANWLFVAPLVVVFFIFVQPKLTGNAELIDEVVDVIGLLISSVGLIIRVVSRDWKLTHGRNRLVVTGPYAIVRNPMYFGSFLVGLGLCVIIGSVAFLALFSILYTITHMAVVRGEERFLAAKWPEEYHQYMASVPRCIPSVSGILREALRRKQWLSSARAAVSRETNPICGVFLGADLLEVREDYFVEGWAATHLQVTILLCLAVVIGAGWFVHLVRQTGKKRVSSR